jgi:hypothetical protein
MLDPISLNSFCSVLSMKSGEPLAGTAMQGLQYVFISWPKNRWARNQFESRHFPYGLSSYLQKLQKEKRVFTRLIHQRKQGTKEHSQIFIMPDGIMYKDILITEIEKVLRGYFEDKPDSKYQRSKANGTYIFCCTHGKRDKCCAKFGQTVIYELEHIAAEKGFDLEVWECTHIGTDRLTATAVAFPHGYMYGRMRTWNVSEIIEYLIKGYPYPPCYRGQVGLSPVEQTAEAFGHFYWFENKIENAEVIVGNMVQNSQDKSETSVMIKDKNSNKIYAEFALILRKKDFSTFIDCDGVKSNDIRKVSRWVISDYNLITHP